MSLDLVLQGVFYVLMFQEIATGGLCMPRVPMLFLRDFEGKLIKF